MLRLEENIVFGDKFIPAGYYKILRKEGSYFWIRKGGLVAKVHKYDCTLLKK